MWPTSSLPSVTFILKAVHRNTWCVFRLHLIRAHGHKCGAGGSRLCAQSARSQVLGTV